MSQNTIPVFVVGSGRSGTRMIYKLLSGLNGIEIHHEYFISTIQPLAAKYYMGLISRKAILAVLKNSYASAVYYSPAKYWIDCSNKLSWLIEPLSMLFPESKFVHIIRDGRKVVSSFYHKLPFEMYDDKSVQILQNWLVDNKLPEPPPEKKYWWNIPRQGQPYDRDFKDYNQFQRICYHWVEILRVIKESLKTIPDNRKLIVKLEDLVRNRQTFKKFLDFVEVDYQEQLYRYTQTPQNVIMPVDFKMTPIESKMFKDICAKTMKEYGYKGKEYEVRY